MIHPYVSDLPVLLLFVVRAVDSAVGVAFDFLTSHIYQYPLLPIQFLKKDLIVEPNENS